MASLSVQVKIFDPLRPGERATANRPGVDTWHRRSLITKDLLQQLSHVHPLRRERLDVSSGMQVETDAVELGVEIGGIRIDRVIVLVVESGAHDLLLGNDILEHTFRLGEVDAGKERSVSPGSVPIAGNVRVSSPLKDDPKAVAIELYPTQGPVELRNLEQFFRNLRRLHNIALLAGGEVRAGHESDDIESVLELDAGVSDELRLRLQWIDSGSIWITLKSGSKSALLYMARLFDTGATVEAEALESGRGNSVDDEVRKATNARVKAEQERLRVENLTATFVKWREEVRQRLDLMDDLIARAGDKSLAAALRKKRDEAVLQIADQNLHPIVRNRPNPFEIDNTLLLLPPPRGDDGGKLP